MPKGNLNLEEFQKLTGVKIPTPGPPGEDPFPITSDLGGTGEGAVEDIEALRTEAARPIDEFIAPQSAQLRAGVEGQLNQNVSNLASQLGSSSSPAFAALASRAGTGAGATIGAGTANLRFQAEESRRGLLQNIAGLSNQLTGIGAGAEANRANNLLGRSQLDQQQGQFEDTFGLQQQQQQLAFLQFMAANPFFFGGSAGTPANLFGTAQNQVGQQAGFGGGEFGGAFNRNTPLSFNSNQAAGGQNPLTFNSINR